MTDTFDVIIIGAGPGGYHSAYLAGKAGLHVLLIERDNLGGTCLNKGCIPTKALLRSARAYHEAQQAALYGVTLSAPPQFNLVRAMLRKQQIIEDLRQGLQAMMARHQVEVLNGEAIFESRQSIRVNDEFYHGKHLIIATGSRPVLPRIVGIDQPHVLTTEQAVEIENLPRYLTIYGGHPISLGFAAIFDLLGVYVTVVTPDNEIMPGIDTELAATLRDSMTNVGFYLSTEIDAIRSEHITFTDGQEITADTVIVNVGRKPNTRGLKALGLDIAAEGVRVDNQMRTNLPNVYAIGDVNGRSMWAHTALREAEVAVNTILNIPDQMRYQSIPTPVYTMPEVAALGLTEQAAHELGYNVRVARQPMTNNGRYMIEHANATRGLCKIIINADNNAILGVHMLGEGSADMIFGAAAMLEDEFRVEDVLGLTFAHPTVSEIIKDTLHMLR